MTHSCLRTSQHSFLHLHSPTTLSPLLYPSASPSTATLQGGLCFGRLAEQSLLTASDLPPMRKLFELVGRPFVQRQANDIAPQQDFGGLEHDLRDLHCWSCPPQAARTPSHEDLLLAVEHALTRPPAASAVLENGWNYGFLFTGRYGQVGRSGQHALRQRMYPVLTTRQSGRLPSSWRVMASWTARKSRASPCFS